MSIFSAVVQGIGGLLKGGAKNSFNRLTGAGPVTQSVKTVAAPVVKPGVGANVLTPAVSGAAGAILGPPVISAAGGAMVTAGTSLQRLAGSSSAGIMQFGQRKKKRRKGITGAELKGFRRVYNFLESHCEPRLKIKRKAKCR